MKSELERIPGVGPNMARHLADIGYTTLNSLRGEDPEHIYQKDCLFQGCQVDRCALYVYRLAVYYAEHGSCPADRLNWWDWKE